jgi:hypothetical protein
MTFFLLGMLSYTYLTIAQGSHLSCDVQLAVMECPAQPVLDTILEQLPGGVSRSQKL